MFIAIVSGSCAIKHPDSPLRQGTGNVLPSSPCQTQLWNTAADFELFRVRGPPYMRGRTQAGLCLPLPNGWRVLARFAFGL